MMFGDKVVTLYPVRKKKKHKENERQALMIIKGKDTTIRPCVATIGSFDGVHLGHQHVISQLARLGRGSQLSTMAVSFSNHPLQVLHPEYQPQMLSTTDEKVERLLKAGADKVALLTFSKEMAAMSAKEFMQSVLRDSLQVKKLMIGYDNHFGHDRCGFETCKQYGQEMGMEVLSCEEWNNGSPVSSTRIRQYLIEGDIDSANKALGYRYTLCGKVVPGFQNGRKLGYPTANICADSQKLIPADGVYLVRVEMKEGNDADATARPKQHQHSAMQSMAGMMNIGTRPTMHNGSNRSIEVHILDFHGDLYGRSLKIELEQRLREEREFGSIESLTAQLKADEAACRRLSSAWHIL